MTAGVNRAPTMKRKLGSTGIEIQPLVFGGNVFGWTADERTSFALLDGFVDAGFKMIDTANVYSRWAPGNNGGESEAIIGRWLKGRRRRDDIMIATKVGGQMSATSKGLAKDYVLREAERSLQRLQTDYIDLYFSHFDDETLPVEEPLKAYARLVSDGKIRVIGASNFSAARLREAISAGTRGHYPLYRVLQPLYNLFDRREYEAELEPICVNDDLGVITYFSLASGFLSGKYRSERDLEGQARSAEVKKYVNERGFRILAAVDEVAKRTNATQAQIALAWLLSRPSVTAPIVSATNQSQLREIIGATQIVLDDASIALLDQAGSS
jgi:aryl-alcohol dehydrogenase-like predicted oxidoreductase